MEVLLKGHFCQIFSHDPFYQGLWLEYHSKYLILYLYVGNKGIFQSSISPNLLDFLITLLILDVIRHKKISSSAGSYLSHSTLTRPFGGESLSRFFFFIKVSFNSISRLSLLIIFDKEINAYHFIEQKILVYFQYYQRNYKNTP